MTAGKVHRGTEYDTTDQPPIRIPDEVLDREMWMAQRKALLDQVDAIERRIGISPTTAQLRRRQKER